jgi:hypothetical protein
MQAMSFRDAREALEHALRMRFGLSPSEPTDSQLDSIIDYAGQLRAVLDRPLTRDEWRDITSQYCPSIGKYKYSELDTTPLDQILERLRGKKNP